MIAESGRRRPDFVSYAARVRRAIDTGGASLESVKGSQEKVVPRRGKFWESVSRMDARRRVCLVCRYGKRVGLLPLR